MLLHLASRRSLLKGAVLLITAAEIAFVLLALAGCGETGVVSAMPALSLSLSSATVDVGQQIALKADGAALSPGCQWLSSNPAVLASSGDGTFRGLSSGNATATLSCSNAKASATVVVTSTASGPIVISQGGTYSGTWTSDDPNTPAVLIQTEEPVTLEDATLTGQGDLIDVRGSGSGARVTVQNVTGIALAPSAGLQRGSFLSAAQVASLKVTHCTMRGVRFGVKIASSSTTDLTITANKAEELEDRESDGNGGSLTGRPELGHFVMLNQVSAPHGADISWNQVVDTIGQSSTEDVFNIYKSQGAAGAPIRVHDNYMEGYSSSTSASYTGSGVIADGDSREPVTAFVHFVANEMVHTAGSGVEIANGHDILAEDNRVVSCGIDPQGNWYAMPFVNAVVVWNYYGAQDFSRIRVKGTTGGMLRPDQNNAPEIADIWARTADLDASDRLHTDSFTDPCYTGGRLNLGAEDAERAFWQQKLSGAGVTLGDQHTF